MCVCVCVCVWEQRSWQEADVQYRSQGQPEPLSPHVWVTCSYVLLRIHLFAFRLQLLLLCVNNIFIAVQRLYYINISYDYFSSVSKAGCRPKCLWMQLESPTTNHSNMTCDAEKIHNSLIYLILTFPHQQQLTLLCSHWNLPYQPL